MAKTHSLILDRSGTPETLRLPLDAVTETFGVLGVRGSGKTTTARVLVEELSRQDQQCVVLDPLGVWWGLRADAEGSGDGLPFTIFGGDHGDVPITAASGTLIADLVVDHHSPVVIDLSGMRKAEQRRFVLPFVETLYHRNHSPLHLVVDEADLYIPQRAIKGQEQLVGAMEDLVRRGRVKGLGVTLISQRPASLHKDVLSQVSVLVCHRLIGPHDRKAVDSWVEANGTKERRDQMMKSVASLATGTAWVWSPSWLDIFKPVAIRTPRTFDSSSTPKSGEQRGSTRLMPLDVDGIKAQMAEVIAEAEKNNPKALRRRITELESEIARIRNDVQVEHVEVVVEVAKPFVPDEVYKMIDGIQRLAADGLAEIREIEANTEPTTTEVATERTAPQRQATRKPAPAKVTTDADPALTKPERAILAVLAQHPAGRTRTQLAILTGYSIKSSSLSNALGSLRSSGYVTKGGGPIQVTAEGEAALGDVEPLPQGQALYDWWASRLSRAEKAVLDAMYRVHPEPVDKTFLAEMTGYSESSSSLSNALGKLRSLELVDGWKVSDDFWESTA